MKVYAALVVLAYVAYCQAADKNFGEFCQSSDKCLGDLTCSMSKGCSYGKCECKSGYTRNSGNTCKKAVTLKKVGESCTANTDCMGAYVTCSSSKCTCNTGNTASSDKATCGKFVGLTCSTASDCGSNMDCTSSACACKSGYKEESKECVGYNLDESCASGKVCRYGKCISDKCSCENNLVSYLKQWCIHKDAKKDLGAGATCTTYDVSTSSGLFCKSGLQCGPCPNEGSKYVCKSGARSVKAGVMTAVFAALLAFFRI